jgi:hypothetical protein
LFQSLSKDSDSLITEELETQYDPALPWFYHPKVRENWKMVLAAFFLLIIGLGMLHLFLLMSSNAKIQFYLLFFLRSQHWWNCDCEFTN